MKRVRSFSRGLWIFSAALAIPVAALIVMGWTAADRGSATAGAADAEPIGVTRTLVWIDRQGHRSPLPVPVRGYVYPRISPDGSRIAVDIRDHAHGIWIWDVAAQSLTPVSTGRGSDIAPVWTHDGRSILFARGRGVAPAILRQGIDPIRPAETLSTVSDSLLLPNSLSPDDAHLVVTASVPSGFDLLMLNLAAAGTQQPLVSTAFDDLNGELSPDGRWLAYQSRQSGQFEIWVRRFDRSVVYQPSAPGPQNPRLSAAPRNIPARGGPPRSREAWPVSDHGGTRPVWARDGRELFYLTVAGQLMAVPIAGGDDFQSGLPSELFTVPVYDDLVGRTFDVSPDGQHFLAVVELMRTQ